MWEFATTLQVGSSCTIVSLHGNKIVAHAFGVEPSVASAIIKLFGTQTESCHQASVPGQRTSQDVGILIACFVELIESVTIKYYASIPIYCEFVSVVFTSTAFSPMGVFQILVSAKGQ